MTRLCFDSRCLELWTVGTDDRHLKVSQDHFSSPLVIEGGSRSASGPCSPLGTESLTELTLNLPSSDLCTAQGGSLEDTYLGHNADGLWI